jgi:formylglycine-generating enzyme required for sulfatase activity
MIPIPVKPVEPGPGGTAPDVPTKSFWIGKTEVTWDMFDIWVFGLDLTEKQRVEGFDAKSRPSKPYGAPDRGFGHAGYPALAMSYHSAELYCKWLSEKTGRKFRLPTEAEWEYACMAGKPADAQESDPAKLDKVAWYWDNANDKTHGVATKAANGFGIHDMLGNVAEWCAGRDGTPVVRGGSYDDEAKDVGCAARKLPSDAWNATDPQNPKSEWWLADGPFIGFRVVCED